MPTSNLLFKNIKFTLDSSITSAIQSDEEKRRSFFVKNVIKGNEYSQDETKDEDKGGGDGGGGGGGGGNPSGKGGQGCIALTPNLSLIPDSTLDVVKGPFTANGKVTVNELIVINGKPVGKDVGRAFLLMKAAAAKDGISLAVNSGFRSPYTSIDKTSSKGTKVTAQSQQSLWDAYQAGKGNLAAKPDTSNHGRAFALDINVGSSNAKNQPPLNKTMYQWLIKNAYKFGLVRYVAIEEWHWEYRPGEYQYNALVPRDNARYKGFDLDCECIGQPPHPPTSPPPPSSTIDAILIGGLDYRTGDYKIDQQVELFKQGFGANKKVKGFRYNDSTDTILEYLKQNPKVPVVMFSAGCSKADSIASSPNVDKNKVWIVECYAVNGNSHVVTAVSSGIPASHVLVGPDSARGQGVVKGAVSSGAPTHWDALKLVGSRI